MATTGPYLTALRAVSASACTVDESGPIGPVQAAPDGGEPLPDAEPAPDAGGGGGGGGGIQPSCFALGYEYYAALTSVSPFCDTAGLGAVCRCTNLCNNACS